jgi:predicted branched-subunit amino acid permease
MIGHVNEPQPAADTWSPPRWVAPLFGFAALALVPWVVLLASELPAAHRVTHWAAAWAGLDVALVAMLVTLAACVWRRSGWVEPAATAAATLLFVDVWFDVTTASSAGGAAIVLELALGIGCLALARRAALGRRRAGEGAS